MSFPANTAYMSVSARWSRRRKSKTQLRTRMVREKSGLDITLSIIEPGPVLNPEVTSHPPPVFIVSSDTALTAPVFGQTNPGAGRGPILFRGHDRGQSPPLRRIARQVGNYSLRWETRSSRALQSF